MIHWLTWFNFACMAMMSLWCLRLRKRFVEACHFVSALAWLIASVL